MLLRRRIVFVPKRLEGNIIQKAQGSFKTLVNALLTHHLDS